MAFDVEVADLQHRLDIEDQWVLAQFGRRRGPAVPGEVVGGRAEPERVVGAVLGHQAAAGGNADDESKIETGRAQGELPCRGDEFDLEPGVPAANPSDGLSLNAIQTIGLHLRRVHTDGEDIEAREAMMLAATRAGIAFSNSSVALVHGMSRPIGAHFHVAHGLSNAMLFPAATAFSVPGAENRYADCARALGATTDSDSNAVAAGRLVEALRALCKDLEVPTPQDHGIDKAEWFRLSPLMAEQALASGSPAHNPVVPTADEIQDLYAQIYA